MASQLYLQQGFPSPLRSLRTTAKKDWAFWTGQFKVLERTQCGDLQTTHEDRFIHCPIYAAYCCCCCYLIVQLLATPWTAARQASLSLTVSWSLLKLMSTEPVMSSNHFILCRPLLLPSVYSFALIRWPWGNVCPLFRIQGMPSSISQKGFSVGLP